MTNCVSHAAYFRHFTRLAAKRVVQAIREDVKILVVQPGISKPAENIEPEYREWLINFGDSGYIALYRYAGQTAVIVAFRHQKEAGC